jgi:tRNA (mo5U34)-methyltransferase
MNWVKRSGFQDIVCFYQAPLSELEQRSTSWAPIKSLSDFLCPVDQQKTIEGYPRPWRFYLRAKK